MVYQDQDNAIKRDQANEHRRKTSTVSKKPKSGFVAKGHDAILERIQKSGKRIEIVLISGEVTAGTIKARDRYTITVTTFSGETTVFKHAIETFKQGKE